MSEENKFEAGKVYNIRHDRQGRFTLRVTGADAVWVRGVIVEGVASALLEQNVKEEGESVSLRISLTSRVEEVSKEEAAS